MREVDGQTEIVEVLGEFQMLAPVHLAAFVDLRNHQEDGQPQGVQTPDEILLGGFDAVITGPDAVVGDVDVLLGVCAALGLDEPAQLAEDLLGGATDLQTPGVVEPQGARTREVRWLSCVTGRPDPAGATSSPKIALINVLLPTPVLPNIARLKRPSFLASSFHCCRALPSSNGSV